MQGVMEHGATVDRSRKMNYISCYGIQCVTPTEGLQALPTVTFCSSTSTTESALDCLCGPSTVSSAATMPVEASDPHAKHSRAILQSLLQCHAIKLHTSAPKSFTSNAALLRLHTTRLIPTLIPARPLLTLILAKLLLCHTPPIPLTALFRAPIMHLTQIARPQTLIAEDVATARQHSSALFKWHQRMRVKVDTKLSVLWMSAAAAGVAVRWCICPASRYAEGFGCCVEVLPGVACTVCCVLFVTV
jgi:hypothetical protein